MPVPDPGPLLDLGLVVFPLPAGSKAATAGWRSTQVRNRSELPGAWPEGANVGVGCRANGLVVLDLDIKDGLDGIASLNAMCESLGEPWPATLTVRTPNGLHLYFRAPARHVIGSTSGGRSGLGSGIDTRGPGRSAGGYVAGPGSVVNGGRYLVENDVDITELPAWIADILTDRTSV